MPAFSSKKAGIDFSPENLLYWILIGVCVIVIWAIVQELIRKIVSV